MDETDERNIANLEDVLTEDQVQQLLHLEMGTDAQLLSWKVRDFTQNDSQLCCCFVTSLDVRFSLQGAEKVTCYAVKLNSSHLSGICNGSHQQKTIDDEGSPPSLNLPSPDVSNVRFSLYSVEDPPEAPPHSLIREEHIVSALTADRGSNARLISWEVTDVTSVKDIITSHYASVDVIFSEKGYNRASYIVKIVPCRHKVQVSILAQTMFLKEADIYMKLVPELISEMQSLDLPPLRLPACFHANREQGKEMLFLEDLRPRGFKMSHRQKGMNSAHATLVVRELARLHAASVLLQKRLLEEEEEDLETKYGFLKVDSPDSKNRNLFGNVLATSVDRTLTLLRSMGGFENPIAWLDRHKTSLHKILEDTSQKTTPFNVFCHGSCWQDNLRFRYDDEGEPLEVMFLNIQWSRISSLATDLNYFSMTSLSAEDRESNMDALLLIYFETFAEVMEAGSIDTPFTLQELKEEYENKRISGFVSALLIGPFTQRKRVDEEEFGDMESDDFEEGSDFRADMMMTSFDKSPSLRSRFLELFRELEKEGLFDMSFLCSDGSHCESGLCSQ